MWLQILNRTKRLLGISDSSKDEVLLLLTEQAVLQVQEYIHDSNIVGLEPIIALYVAHLYQSGETLVLASAVSSEGTSSAVITPQLGEVKSVSYPEGVSVSYTTSADFVNKSSSKTYSLSSTGDPGTYFYAMIAPYLTGRRHIQTVKEWSIDESVR